MDAQTDGNKALCRRWFEAVVTGGDLALADELLAADYVLHFPGLPGPVDREGHTRRVAGFRGGFPDWRETVEDGIAAGDRVAVRVTGRGTHRGEFPGIPPTGRVVTAPGIGIGRLAGGRLAAAWAAYDALGPLQQLGAVPAPPGAGSCARPGAEATLTGQSATKRARTGAPGRLPPPPPPPVCLALMC